MPAIQTLKPAKSKRINGKIVIVVSLLLILIVLAIGAYYRQSTPAYKTAVLAKKIEGLQKQIETIPDLKTKQNVEKLKKLTIELQAAQDEQWKNLENQATTSR